MRLFREFVYLSVLPESEISPVEDIGDVAEVEEGDLENDGVKRRGRD